jgi:hypothetical protein
MCIPFSKILCVFLLIWDPFQPVMNIASTAQQHLVTPLPSPQPPTPQLSDPILVAMALAPTPTWPSKWLIFRWPPSPPPPVSLIFHNVDFSGINQANDVVGSCGRRGWGVGGRGGGQGNNGFQWRDVRRTETWRLIVLGRKNIFLKNLTLIFFAENGSN